MRWRDGKKGIVLGGNATDGRSGGAAPLLGLEMDRCVCRTGGMDQGAILLDLVKASARVSLTVVWAWANVSRNI